MQKKLNVKLIKSGSENDILTRWIAGYNEGKEKTQISPRDLEGYLLTRNAIYPILFDLKLIKDETDGDTYHVSEDGGKTFTMSIEWVQVYELPKVDAEIEKELEPNDLQGVNI